MRKKKKPTDYYRPSVLYGNLRLKENRGLHVHIRDGRAYYMEPLERPLIEDWREYTEHLTSPNSYITMSFYYMMAAALQRRVWVGSCEMPIFPNMYIILCGEPGIGKGIVIKPSTGLMGTHRLKEGPAINTTKTLDPKALITIEDYISEIKALQGTKPTSYIKEDPLLFPIPADATTYRALTNANSNCHRYFKCSEDDKRRYRGIVPPSGIYGHSSMCFFLEELSSLFRKHAEDVINYLLVAWDCGDYTYATQHHGVDKVRKTCLSLLAGTTPGFMRSVFSDRLIDEGFSARTLFVFESENRKTVFGIPDLSERQHACKLRILTRLRELSTLFGQAQYTPEAYDYFKGYFEKVLPVTKVNPSPKLLPYYAKKVQHAQKLAMAIHFADSNDMMIPLKPCQMSLEILASLEGRMHYALTGGAKTVQGNNTRKLLENLMKASGTMNLRDLWMSLEGDAKDIEVLEMLAYLEKTGQIVKTGKLEWRKK